MIRAFSHRFYPRFIFLIALFSWWSVSAWLAPESIALAQSSGSSNKDSARKYQSMKVTTDRNLDPLRFELIGEVHALYWYVGGDQEFCDYFFSSEDSGSRLTAFPFASSRECSVASSPDDLGGGQLKDTHRVVVQIKESSIDRSLILKVLWGIGEDLAVITEETFISGLQWKSALEDDVFHNLVSLLVLDALPFWFRANEDSGAKKQRLSYEKFVRTIGSTVDLIPTRLGWSKGLSLFRAEMINAGVHLYSPTQSLREQLIAWNIVEAQARLAQANKALGDSSDQRHNSTKLTKIKFPEREQVISRSTEGGGSIFYVNRLGRGVLRSRIRGSLYERLESLTRESVHRERAAVVNVFAGVAPDFVTSEPRFTLGLEGATWLNTYVGFSLAVESIQNSIPVELEALDEQAGQENKVNSFLSFDEIFMRPSLILSTPRFLRTRMSVYLGYAFQSQQLGVVDLDTAELPEIISESINTAPSFAVNLNMESRLLFAEIGVEHSLIASTGKTSSRSAASLDIGTSFSALTFGAIDELNGYIGLGLRYYSHAVELSFGNAGVSGSLVSSVITTSLGLMTRVSL